MKYWVNRERPHETMIWKGYGMLSNICMRREFPSYSFVHIHLFTSWHLVSHYALNVLITVLFSSWWQSGWQCLFFRKAHFAFVFIGENVRTFTLLLPLIIYSAFLACTRCLSNIFICAWINTSTLSFHNACKQNKPFTLCFSTIIDFCSILH